MPLQIDYKTLQIVISLYGQWFQNTEKNQNAVRNDELRESIK